MADAACANWLRVRLCPVVRRRANQEAELSLETLADDRHFGHPFAPRDAKAEHKPPPPTGAVENALKSRHTRSAAVSYARDDSCGQPDMRRVYLSPKEFWNPVWIGSRKKIAHVVRFILALPFQNDCLFFVLFWRVYFIGWEFEGEKCNVGFKVVRTEVRLVKFNKIVINIL